MTAQGSWASHLAGLMDTKVNLSGEVPQGQPLDKRQVENNAGGFAYQVDDLCRLRRFLILGSEGGSYYQGETTLTLENARGVRNLLEGGQGLAVVQEVVAVSTAGRAPKQGPAIFALALCCRLGDKETKKAAFHALPAVCRTASTLFDFVGHLTTINKAVAEGRGASAAGAGWGRATRTAIADWYLAKDPMALAYQVTKYGQRGGWSNRDLLRLAHPRPARLLTKRKAPEPEAAPAPPPPSPADADDQQWIMVEESTTASAASGEGGAEDAAAGLAQRVADLQLLFRYIVGEEREPPPPQENSPVAAYLRDAHTLKKGNTRAEPPRSEGEEAATLAEVRVEEAKFMQREPTAETSAAEASAEAAEGGKQKKKAKVAVPVVRVTEAEACALIRSRRFSREHVGDTALLTRPAVWEALLDVAMPFTALARNLGKLTQLGVLGSAEGEHNKYLQGVVQRFTDEKAVKASRAHPITLLQVQRVYAAGRGDKGSLAWDPLPPVTAALEAAFYLAFKNVVPTGKRFLAAVDVSGSMDWSKCAGMDKLTAREAATAMLMSLLRTEDEVGVLAFSTQLQALPVTRADTLQQAISKCNRLAFGGTDCALPMLHAIKKNLQVDVFVVYTDNETWFGEVHPSRALQMYRQHSGIAAQLVVMGFSATSFSIADPADSGMLDIAGLDSGVPEVLRQFVVGDI